MKKSLKCLATWSIVITLTFFIGTGYADKNPEVIKTHMDVLNRVDQLRADFQARYKELLKNPATWDDSQHFWSLGKPLAYGESFLSRIHKTSSEEEVFAYFIETDQEEMALKFVEFMTWRKDNIPLKYIAHRYANRLKKGEEEPVPVEFCRLFKLDLEKMTDYAKEIFVSNSTFREFKKGASFINKKHLIASIQKRFNELRANAYILNKATQKIHFKGFSWNDQDLGNLLIIPFTKAVKNLKRFRSVDSTVGINVSTEIINEVIRLAGGKESMARLVKSEMQPSLQDRYLKTITAM